MEPGPSDPTEQSGAAPTRRLPLALATWMLIGLVLLIVVVLLVVKLTRGSAVVTPAPVTPAPAGIVYAASNVQAQIFDDVSVPQAPALTAPTKLGSGARLVLGNRPAVVYVGAEFCPYCAAERWTLVVALSRFGTFHKLGSTQSSQAEVFPDTKTFSFAGSTYSSPWISFDAVEAWGDVLSTSSAPGYAPDQRPDAIEAAVMRRYGGTPQSGGTGPVLPVVDLAGVALQDGAGIGFSPGLLEGLSMSQISADLSDPTTMVARAILGSANEVTAALCVATGQRPESVCNSPGVLAGALKLGIS